MSNRYTKADAQRAFERLLEAANARPAQSRNDVGGWLLDYNSIYGGYVVTEVMSEPGGISNPFGYKRRNAREFCGWVRAVTDGINLGRRQAVQA